MRGLTSIGAAILLMTIAGWTFAVCGSRTREPLHVYLQHPDGLEAQSSMGWSRFFGDIRREHVVKDAWNLVSGCVADLARESRALDAGAAWAAWNEGASDRIPQVGEQVRIWNPLSSKEVVVEVTDTSAKSFEGLFEGGRRMWLPPMTLVKELESALARE